jgi:hypothetical protein
MPRATLEILQPVKAVVAEEWHWPLELVLVQLWLLQHWLLSPLFFVVDGANKCW